MNILIIVNSHFISGAERSLIEYIDECSSIHNYYFCISEDNIEMEDYLSKYQVIKLPFIFFSFSYNPVQLLKYFFNIIFISLKVRKIIFENKINIIYSNSVKGHIYCLPLKVLVRIPIVWHVRDNIKNRLINSLFVFASKKIICISKHIYSQVVDFSASKIVLVYGGISLKQFNPNKNDVCQNLRSDLGLQPNKTIIAQIGQITRWKNQIEFIKCAKIIIDINKNVHFIIVGNANSTNDRKYLVEIKNEILRYNISDYISIIDYTANINEIYSQVDVLVHPSIKEPFGRVIVEAMAFKIPVVAYNLGGPKEIIQNEVSGFLVEPYNYKSIAEKVLILLSDKSKRIAFGEEGRKIVQMNFNIEKKAKELELVFNGFR